ncbi:MAG: thiL [Herminiimonas sp.]|nr:thiL [Herminiimonas sp.]
MLSEFDLIERYFTPSSRSGRLSRADLGIGDDCALVTPSAGSHLAISTDMLVAGRHFFENVDPASLGFKSLVVNLSDLAAMGASPLAFTLALALPSASAAWLEGFSSGLFRAADDYDCELIGGDTTRGPLTISITIFGEVPIGQALRRDAAEVDDDIWVSGALGDAAAGLGLLRGELALASPLRELAISRLEMPIPRVALGIALRGIAHAAIDISDGLLGDLGHILKRSGVGALIEADLVPLGPALQALPASVASPLALNGGDDYELCFTAPVDRRAAVIAAASGSGCAATRIGRITSQEGLVLIGPDGNPVAAPPSSFDHFRTQ